MQIKNAKGWVKFMKPDENQTLIEELSWAEARKYAIKGCPKLLNIIDDINPGKNLTFVKVRYPFGSIIAKDDVLHLPSNGMETIPINDSSIDKRWKEKLGYRSIPTGMITENSLEIYREIDGKVFSVALSGPNTGLEIGIVENFGSTAAYTVSAGTRSLYMIPRISKTAAHKRLRREFGILSPPPKRLLDHWHIFKELYASPVFKTNWFCELIFLSKEWFSYIDNDDSACWLKLRSYIQQKGWEHSELGRRKVILDVVWQQASGLLTSKGMKPDPYVVDTLKHLIFLSLGGISGCRPVNGDDFAGPINEIQNIYLDVYGLSSQIPTIMRPYNFSLSEDKPIYYSMQSPMLLSSTPNFRSMSSNIEDMRELMIIKSYVFGQDYGNLKIDNVKFNDTISQIKFDYYHGDMFAYGSDIRPTKELPEADPELLYMPQSISKHKFADNGAYIRGCIKISKQKGIV